MPNSSKQLPQSVAASSRRPWCTTSMRRAWCSTRSRIPWCTIYHISTLHNSREKWSVWDDCSSSIPSTPESPTLVSSEASSTLILPPVHPLHLPTKYCCTTSNRSQHTLVYLQLDESLVYNQQREDKGIIPLVSTEKTSRRRKVCGEIKCPAVSRVFCSFGSIWVPLHFYIQGSQ